MGDVYTGAKAADGLYTGLGEIVSNGNHKIRCIWASGCPRGDGWCTYSNGITFYGRFDQYGYLDFGTLTLTDNKKYTVVMKEERILTQLYQSLTGLILVTVEKGADGFGITYDVWALCGVQITAVKHGSRAALFPQLHVGDYVIKVG